MDLFEAGLQARQADDQPLAARLRPRHLDEYIGQNHILGPGRLLRRAIQADQLASLIFYGPPGTGKTTLASVIANTTSAHFIAINAVLAGVADIRQAVDEAGELRKLHGRKTILFIDEVHRFNKAQQDALLPWVENGTILLIGATTENPYFSVNRPLLSRSRVFQLQGLNTKDLEKIALQALVDPRGYGNRQVALQPDALAHLVDVANGDARALLNALELAVETTEPNTQGEITVDLEVAEESIQRRALLYDKEGDYHFDTISAFIKSLRGSDPDATLYWLARMVYAGEDPRFLFRRMLIFASEDIGLADTEALQVVVAAAESFDRVGLPEGRFSLAHAALYLATAPKSNSTLAFFNALETVEKEQEDDVPNHLKDASRDSEGFGHGAGYLYPHAYRDHWVAQQYLPSSLQGRAFYQPSDQGREKDTGDQIRRRRELQLAAMVEGEQHSNEVLSFSPPDQQRDQWLKRAGGEISAQLERLRDRLFTPLNLERHHLVLDLESNTGLLTWEAMRRVPEGRVWAHSTDKIAAIALHETATYLPELERPEVIQGPLLDLAEQVDAREPGLRFDAVLGRNALGPLADKAEVAVALAKQLAPQSRISLVETLSCQSQRLHQLVDLNRLDPDLSERLIAAEEAIYADASNPQVNWNVEDLVAHFTAAGFTQVQSKVESLQSQRLIELRQLNHWFSPGGEKRHTYANFLAQALDEDELQQVRKLFDHCLANHTVTWTTSQVFLVAKFGESTVSTTS
ncbi:MAG: AAA family ATPase [Gemmatimonadetes bacterium]|nr:AAA family ATPase [Gemmatimonadota bacterium]